MPKIVNLRHLLTLCCFIFMALFSSTSHAYQLLDSKPNFQLDSVVQHPIHHKPKIALVLGSGGARGYAHIGVIKVLEQHGIKPDFIVGTSAGSIVGSLYASGKSPQEIEQIALALKTSDVRDFTLSKQGFFDGKKVEDYINKLIDYRALEHMQIPLYIVATELKNGTETIFYRGNTGQAVRASTSIPSMFLPTKIGDKEYVDGGLVSPVPVNVAKKLGADVIIAVDILARPEYTETSNIWGLFNQNVNVMQNRLAQYESQQADIVIRPDIREKVHVFATETRQQSITAGEKSTQQNIQQILTIIKEKTHQENSQQTQKVQY